MKKVIGVFLTMVMVFLVISMNVSLAENKIVEGYYGSTVQDFVEEWMRAQKKDEKYFNNTVNEFGYFYGHGVMLVNEFEETYGIEWNNESMEKVLAEHYSNLEFEVKTIGFYEGYNVYLMKAKSTDPIGYTYSYGEQYPFYEGEMIYMACIEP